MTASISTLALVAVITLSIFMGFLALFFWHVQRDELTSFWLAAWLVACAIFAFTRLMQYASLSDSRYILAARIILTVGYSLAWLGYEFANSFLGYRPPIWERALMIILTAVPAILLWTTGFILTNQIVIRRPLLGGEFHGVAAGSLYLPASLLILALGVLPPVRLARAKNSHKQENSLIAMGYLFVILFSLNDFISTALNLNWIRLSDFSYMPVAILFSYVQVERFAHLYKDMNVQVQARTAELSRTNETLRSEINERRNAEDEIRRKADEFAALYEVTSDLVAHRDLQNLLKMIVERAKTLLNAPSGSIFLYDEIQQNLEIVIASGVQLPAGTRLDLGEGMAGRVAQTRQPLILEDYSGWEFRSPQYEGLQMTASIQAPMLYGDKLIGVLDVTELQTTSHKFTEADMHLLMHFANQAAIAVENARLFEGGERRRRETAAIAEVGRDISASLQLDIVLDRIAFHAKDLLDAITSAVYLSEPGAATLRAIAAIGPDAEEIKHDPRYIGEGILGNIALRKTGEIVNCAASDPRAITIIGTEVIPDEHLMGVPVLSRDQLTGLIAVWRIGKGKEFNAADLDFLTSLAQQAAIAIENAHLFEETKKRLREIESIAQVSAALSHTLELEPLLENVIQSAIHAISVAERGSILLADEEGNLRVRAVWGYTDARTRALVFSPGAGYSTLSFYEHRSIVVPDVQADARTNYDSDIPELQTGGSALAVPLVVKNHTIGVIAIDTPTQLDAFTESDLHLLEALASPAALAIENARLFEDTRRRLAELEIVQTIASALRIAQTPEEAFPIILTQLVNLLDVECALVDLLDPSGQEIVSVSALGVWAPISGLRTPSNEGVSGRVIATGQPYITTHLAVDGLVARPDLVYGVNAVACVPIVAQHRPIGSLWIGRQAEVAISREEVNLLSALGEMLGNTIQRMNLHEQTVVQAEQIASAYDLTLEGWAKALELRDKETEGHSRRVTELTLQLARQFGIREHELPHIRRGVLLHDIGKMGVPDQILKKMGPLDQDEWQEMRNHPQYAFDLLYPITYLRPALAIPYCHHEHWDGSGYPRGLKGEQIPLAARIFAVVDVYDALSYDRPYRIAWPREKVLEYLREQSGKYFDPKVVEVFIASSFE